jgi:hypothetical protein
MFAANGCCQNDLRKRETRWKAPEVCRKRELSAGKREIDIMKLRGLVLAMVLLLPSSALADPVTSGVWTTVRTPMFDQQTGAQITPFWGGLSWDCNTCGVGYLLNAYQNEEIEYLHDGFGNAAGFLFGPNDNITTPTFVGGITMWTNGVFGRRADGAFTYDSGTGHVSNSWDNGAQYALFRIVGHGTTTYFLGIEDILVSYTLNDHDHNDYIVTFEQHDVPEPSSLMLMGLAAAGFAARRRLRRN